jgi:hypothetical protein
MKVENRIYGGLEVVTVVRGLEQRGSREREGEKRGTQKREGRG